jgi:hypothetical protein
VFQLCFNLNKIHDSLGKAVRGGPLEIPGGGVKIPKKKSVQRKMPGKKIRAAITSEKKNTCKQTAKYE